MHAIQKFRMEKEDFNKVRKATCRRLENLLMNHELKTAPSTCCIFK
jgi:hypothetical protein